MESVDPSDAYQVKLQGFEGPLELLLHLIKENEIDIYEIPIALITQQYLAYLNLLESLNLSVAGEFLVMAATLLLIKSRMLLPPEAQAEEEGEDPRHLLVRRLLEYQRYRDAADQLEAREALWREIFRRPAPTQENGNQEIYLADLNPFDLLTALQKVLERAPKSIQLQISKETLSVKDKIRELMDRFSKVENLRFEELFDPSAGRYMVIVTFLALLEIARLGLLRLFQAEGEEVTGVIRITRTENLATCVGGDDGRG